eukprot:40834-Rhodomonas_salina.1
MRLGSKPSSCVAACFIPLRTLSVQADVGLLRFVTHRHLTSNGSETAISEDTRKAIDAEVKRLTDQVGPSTSALVAFAVTARESAVS